jgi:Ca2+-binding EF-hand superfamily protein
MTVWNNCGLKRQKEIEMTSVSSTSGGNGAYYAMQKDIFNKIDADKSGSLSQTEFVSARPKNVTEDQASQLYSKMDTNNTGSVSIDQFAANGPGSGPASHMSGDAMAVVMGLNQGGGMMPRGGHHEHEPDVSELYAKIDTNSDGTVTKDEFIGSRPDNMSEDKATKIYSSIDTENTGSITEKQLAESMEHGHDGPPMGPPPADMAFAADEANTAV